jgi:uncharacterized protein (DUF1810 family)
MKDDYNLQRFVDAQAGVFEGACAELRRPMAEYYGIASLAEARAYMEDPQLGERLMECSRIVTLIEGRSLREIFGTPDDMKFKSSMTLFAHAVPENSVFIEALNQYCGGKFDSLTLDLLRSG